MADEAGTPGRRYIEAVINGTAAPAGYTTLLGMRVTAVGDGTATFEMPVTESLYNPNAMAHGGALSSLLDSAMGFAVVSTLGPGENFTTVDLTVNFIRPVTVESGMLRSIGRVIHRGRQIAVAEATCTDAAGQLVARASSTNLVFSGTPPQVVEAQPAATASSAPPSALEHEPPMTTPVTTPPAMAVPAFAQSKLRVRLFAGDMAYVRRGQGPPVVLLHGIPSSSYLWRDVIDPLATRFDVVAPDLLGYGDSDKRVDADLSVAAQERWIIALLEALGIQRAVVVGHDIGGGIAQLMAADEPERVAKLVLVDSIVDDNWPIPAIARLHDPFWDQRLVTADLRQGFGEGLDAGLVTPGRVTPDLLDEWVRPFSDQAGRRAYLRAARALNNKDLTVRSTDIRAIRIPTLIVWGANDKFLEKTWADKLKGKIEGSVVQVIDPGGHFLPIDRPDALVPLLMQFLSAP
jgi:uncharacterized protein (TIGR00369 family)